MLDLTEKKAFDLSKLGDELNRRQQSGDKRFEKYRIAIEEFEAASSILRDLSTARSSVETLHEIHADESMRRKFGQPLFTHAVLTYCRALVSETNARRRINVDSKVYDKDLREKHIAIKNLRSTAMAHYHRGEGKHGNAWVKDTVAARPIKGELLSIDVFVRTNFKAAALADLTELLQVAIPYVVKERSRRGGVLDNLLSHALQNDFAFTARMTAHAFDPTEFFNNEFRAADSFWGGVEIEGETYSIPATPTQT